MPICECRSRVENGATTALGVEAEHRRRSVDREPLPANAYALHVHIVVGRVLLVCDDGCILHGTAATAGGGASPRPEVAGLGARANRRCRRRSSRLHGAGVSVALRRRRGGGGGAAAAEGDGARGGGRSRERHQAIGKRVGDGGLELRVEGERALAESHEPPGARKRAFVVVAATDRDSVAYGRT